MNTRGGDSSAEQIVENTRLLEIFGCVDEESVVGVYFLSRDDAMHLCDVKA